MPTEWITAFDAAALVGCHRHTIDRYAQAGHIARRFPSGRKSPTLNRVSVEEFAQWWCARELEAVERRLKRDAARSGPPEDGDVWLDSTTASLVVGVSPQYLRRLARQGRLPAAATAGRPKWWFRRQDVEQFAAARALRAQG